MLKRRAKLDAIFSVLAEWRDTTSLKIKAVGAKIRLGLNAQEMEHRVYEQVVKVRFCRRA